MTRLLILGSANADHVMNLEYLPSAGQTLSSQNYRLEHGGKGANQAVAVARLRDPNTRVDFICHLGDDAIGESMADSWLSDGIQSDGIIKQSTYATGTAMIFVANNGENMIGISAGANASLTPKALEQHHQLIVDADYLLTQFENPVATIIAALALAKDHGVTTILNPAPATVVGKELFGLVDIITPNETEAETLTGIEVTDEESAKLAAQILHQLGPKTVIITLGQQGALLSCDRFSGIIPTVEVKTIDTVAAGDTFNGALMIALSEGKDMVSAVKFAHRASALTVTREGAQRSIPYRHEIND